MINKIVSKEDLAPQIKKIVVEAPLVAQKVLPGQFVVIIVSEKGERVPLTVAERDREQGTVTIIFQEIGKTTYQLGKLEAGDSLAGLLGPLGRPTEIEKLGLVVTVGGGVGIAEVYPVTRAFKEAGSRVISIIGARSKEQVILEDQMRGASDELFITTDDGSYQRKGFVSDVLKEILARDKADMVYAVGPLPMMRVVSEITRGEKIKTRVSLNPVMVDATGMCGSCRVSVGGETKFGCVDGPEFDGHLVDYAELEKRLKQFLQQEKRAMEAVKR